MPVIGNSRKQYSEFVKQTGHMETDGAGNFYFARTDVQSIGGGADETVEPIGIPVIWNNTDGQFEQYDGTITVAAALANDSVLPDGAVCGFIVGPAAGKGLNEEDVVLTAAGTEVTVLFRGDAFIVDKGITWHAGADAGEQALFLKQIEKQDIAVQVNADEVDPYFVEA